MKTYQAVLVGLLISFILLSGLSFPTKNSTLVANPDLTPTVTPKAGKDSTEFESGDTLGLIYGAGVIVLITLGGIFIQRLINKPASSDST
jgi:hypothetical protein